ncbi:MAG: hypothetical protein CUN55_19940 [Phototrophicales bacterium]|nr:MAG: hypothetical protein CUN55_19940 [Phototrophicales bacterium]
MRGESVRRLQDILAREGFYKSNLRGYYGDLTRMAVRALQAAHGLDVDGIVGPSTRAVLNNLACQH